MSTRRRFAGIAAAGITFQAGSAAIDSATIMSALVLQLTGSPLLVGAVTAILRFGWLFPQLIVGFLAQRRGSSMRYYAIGAFGRATCMALMAAVLFAGRDWPVFWLALSVLAIWTGYAFVSGIVAVPYNDIVARSVPSQLRSRLLATRFFGGGVLALGVAAIADRLLERTAFPLSYAAIIGMAAILMYLSSIVFTGMGEPAAAAEPAEAKPGFFAYLKDGMAVMRADRRFRLFVYAQWCGGAVLMAMPFYVVQADALGLGLQDVAILLLAQTAGALASNLPWGWWGDKWGKVSLLRAIATARFGPPAFVIALSAATLDAGQLLAIFTAVFFVLGALANGLTIAVIGYLMEISPEARRPAYSGYFNAITAPAFLLPLIAGGIASAFGLSVLFAISALAAALQGFILLQVAPRLAPERPEPPAKQTTGR